MKLESPEALAVRVERALLGELLRAPALTSTVLDLVAQRDFYALAHQPVFDALLEVRADADADLLAVEAALLRTGTLRAAGGLLGLADLAAMGGMPSLVRSHARRVREAAESRRLRIAAGGVAADLAQGRLDVGEAAERLRGASVEALTTLGAEDAGAIPALLDTFEAEALAASDGRSTRLLPCVDPLIDDVLVPLGPGEMLVIGARPGKGKSNLAGDLAFGWGRTGAVGVVLTAEDAPTLWTAREAAKLGQDSDALDHLRTGYGTVREWTAWREARAAIERLPVRVEAIAGKRACEVAARMRGAAARGARFAVVDYVQLVRPTDTRGASSASEDVTAVASELLDAAIEAGLALVLVSQMRRSRPGVREPRPTMADLRGSGMLEARATAVILIWRYSSSDYSLCRIIRDKWKHGPPAEAHVGWLPARRHFWALAESVRDSDASF